MRPTDQTRAELYARSALYATTVLRKPKLADTFARRGKALVGDAWAALLAQAADPQPAAQLPLSGVEERKAARTGRGK